MKYVLCRPRGGLNDTLTQIEFCWQYAEISNRILVVDTEYLTAPGISVQFAKLFEPVTLSEKIYLKLPPEMLEEMNSLSTFPVGCAGRLDKYWIADSDNSDILCDGETGDQLLFDWYKSYDQFVLLRDQAGGSDRAIRCLSRLRLTDKFRADILTLLSILSGNDHMAVMVRHTDYKTDYKAFFDEIYHKLANQKVLLCTDSLEVQKYALSYFDKSELITFNLSLETYGMGLAKFATYHCSGEQRYRLMVKAMADLVGMATASEVIYSRMTSESSIKGCLGINGFSGFAILAESLRNNPSIINQLFLGNQNI